MTELQRIGNKEFADGLKRFGIENSQSLGVKVPELRRIARQHKNNHNLALQLWQSPIHEMKILATIVDDPNKVTIEQVDKWTSDLYSWDLCDQLSVNLLSKTDFATVLIDRYINSKHELVKRTAFVITASLATNYKNSSDKFFQNYIELVVANCDDNRNYVKKGANWALKNIGKRNANLARLVSKKCNELSNSNRKTEQWIGHKTLNDLNKYYETK